MTANVFRQQRRTAAAIDYDMAIAEGRQIIGEIERARDKYLRLGELADAVERGYGEKKLEHFAREIGIAACTAKRLRSVFRAWKEAPAPPSYAVAQELQALPDRHELIRQNPNMTKREARQFRRRHDRETRAASDHLRENMERWFRDVVRHAGEAVRDAHFVDGDVTPELREVMQEVVEPMLLSDLRAGGEALIRLADYLEQLTREEEPREQVTVLDAAE